MVLLQYYTEAALCTKCALSSRAGHSRCSYDLLWWLPVPLSLQTVIILLQQFVKKLCYDMEDKIPVQKGREEACEATLCEAAWHVVLT